MLAGSTETSMFIYHITLRRISRDIHFNAYGRSQWPRCLRRGSATARLLGLRVRIPPLAWMSLSYECCMLSGSLSETGWSLIQSSSTECVVSECDREAFTVRWSWPTRDCCAMNIHNARNSCRLSKGQPWPSWFMSLHSSLWVVNHVIHRQELISTVTVEEDGEYPL